MAAIYLDSSAIVKLAVREPESDALRRYLRTRHPRVSSALARAEVMRALLDKGESARKAGRRALAHLDLLRVDKRVLDLAGGRCHSSCARSMPSTWRRRSGSASIWAGCAPTTTGCATPPRRSAWP